MGRTNFIQVFSLEVHHTFFQENICNCIQFRPSEQTQQLMKRFGFLIRYKINGFEIYTDNANSLPDFFSYISKTLPGNFAFSAQTERSNFDLFTDIPVDRSGAIGYDSGLSTVETNGVVTLLPDMSDNASSALANITINFSDILRNMPGGSAARFQISFKARVTQWQYYIVNNSNIQLNNPGVAGKYNISFTGPVDIKTPGGETALLFTSGESLLPFTENVQYQFDFVNNYDIAKPNDFVSESNILYKGLPVPDPWSTLFVNNNGSPIFFSPVYVYL